MTKTCRGDIPGRSGQVAATWRVLDSVGATHQLGEALERLGEEPREPAGRRGGHREGGQITMLEESGP